MATVTFFLVAGGPTGCRDQPPHQAATTDTPAKPPDVAVPAAAVADSGTPVSADSPQADGGTAALDGPAPPVPTAVVETTHYELMFERIARCGPSAAGAAAVAPGKKKWIGAAVRVRPKEKDLFLTAHDFTLEKGGVVLDARHVNPPHLPGCMPLVQPRQLALDEAVRGFVLFEVPVQINEGPGPLLLAYRPTRWGGARRAEFRIPDCFDECTESALAQMQQGKPAASTTKSSKTKKKQ